MAPKRGLSVEGGDEYDIFTRKLKEYHEKRGTNFEPAPKVGIRHVDLRKLYERVVGEGGYDIVSDTKARPLMWRKLAEEFLGKNPYLAAQAFQVKNIYYKNLVAYEISDHWNKVPPPKEILEEVTAKGGNVMTRTLENFARPASRAEAKLQNAERESSSPEPETTPKEEKPEPEDPGSASGRTSRGLRHAPPQRVLFQPETAPSRQARFGMAQHTSPTPGAATSSIMYSNHLTNGLMSYNLASYEPSQSLPLSLKPVTTPGNNPEYYKNERKRKAEAMATPVAKKYKGMMLPGTGYIGPNIYVRAQLALQSGLEDEEQYALHHLVKISHERGDKYRFDQFPGLAEALVKKVLHVSSLFWNVDWDVNYDEEACSYDEEALNALSGTSDIIQRLKARIPLMSNDNIHTHGFLSQLGRVTESALVIRNMCMLDENAQYLAKQAIAQDYLAIVLNLPMSAAVAELKYYALETAEQVLRYCYLGADYVVYQSLLSQLDTDDRGAIVISLRTISRIGMGLETNKRLDDVPNHILTRICNWLLIEDEELRSACLDFLTQFTTVTDNVEQLVLVTDSETLVRQLSRLLSFGAKEHRKERPSSPHHEENVVAPVPRLSRSLVEALLRYEEPERSSEWLRMCFQSDALAEMTQISLWQAYQGIFAPYQATHPHLIAGDFIKNVSNTFSGATAQVAGANKYVIKGIKPRAVPIDSCLGSTSSAGKGRELHKCHWEIEVQLAGGRDPVSGIPLGPVKRRVECGEWFSDSDDMLRHILSQHLKIPRKCPESVIPAADEMEVDAKPGERPSSATTNGAPSSGNSIGDVFDFKAAEQSGTQYACHWGKGCTRTSASFDNKPALFARHIQTHLPSFRPTTSSGPDPMKHNLAPDAKSALDDHAQTRLSTMDDERGEAAGLPFSACLVLRNIARGVPKMAGAVDEADGDGGVMKRLFDEEVKETLFWVMGMNSVLRDHVATVLRGVRVGGG